MLNPAPARKIRLFKSAALATVLTLAAPAALAQAPIPYTVIHPGEPAGDHLAEARRIAAAVVAADTPSPKLVVDIGSDTGEFLEAFMQQFPQAKGQWTEPVTLHRSIAMQRLARFAPRVTYVIGCASRIISPSCVPNGTDVIITAWLQVHQDLPGIQNFYDEAYKLLPSGGWVVNLDHVSAEQPDWNARLAVARKITAAEGLNGISESPPIHHKGTQVPTLQDQETALKQAGFTDYQVVWRRYDTVLLMAKKS